jgi:2'-5' RNA ligase
MPDDQGALRLFVACAVPNDTQRGLAAVQDDLRRAGYERLRFVRAEGIHITLKFLGSVAPQRLDAISAALAGVIGPFEARMTLDRLGGFGGNRIRVVWASIAGDIDVLGGLAASIDAALMPLGFPREKRPFAAHLTLARVPEQCPPEERRRLASFVKTYVFPPFPPMTVSDVHLMRSRLGPGGAKYERLVSFPAKLPIES